MLNVSQEIKDLLKSDSVPKHYRMLIMSDSQEFLLPAPNLYPSPNLYPLPGGEIDLEITNDKLRQGTLRITESVIDSGDMIFGTCNSSMLEFECADITTRMIGRELIVLMYVGDAIIPLGIYIIDSVERQANTWFKKITAFDRMKRFERNVTEWYRALSFPISIQNMFSSLCGYVGLQSERSGGANWTTTVAQTIDPTEISGWDVLQSIAEITGTFGRVNREGKVILRPISTAVTDTVPIAPRMSLDFEDYTVGSITGLTIRQETNDIGASAGTGTNNYVVQGNFLAFGKTAAQLATMASNLLNVIRNITYIPVTLDCRGLPYLETGDMISVETNRGEYINTLIFKRTLSGDHALSDRITSTGSEARTETFGINKSVIQLEGRYNLLERTVDANILEVGRLNNGVSRIEQRFDSIALSVQNGTNSSSIRLMADGVAVSSATITLSGMVTFNDLAGSGTTEINGDNIRTGSIESIEIYGCDIRGCRISAFAPDENTGFFLYQTSNTSRLLGRIYRGGAEFDGSPAMFIQSLLALKLEAGDGMSFDAGTIFFRSWGRNNNIQMNAAGDIRLYTDNIVDISAPGGLYVNGRLVRID